MSAELYLSVFRDGVLSSLLIPIHSQTAFFAILAFGEQEAATLHIAVVMAVLGATVGHSINWLLGLGVLRLVRGYWDKSYEKIRPRYNSYGIWALLLSFLPLFGIFSFAAGLFKVSPLRVVLLVLFSQAAYYLHYLNNA